MSNTTDNEPGEALVAHEVAAIKRRMLYLQKMGSSDCGLTPWSVLRLITTIETRSPLAAVGRDARLFEAKLLGFGDDDRIRLCEPCVRRATADNFVIFACALPLDAAGRPEIEQYATDGNCIHCVPICRKCQINEVLAHVREKQTIRDEIYTTALSVLCDPDVFDDPDTANRLAASIADKAGTAAATTSPETAVGGDSGKYWTRDADGIRIPRAPVHPAGDDEGERCQRRPWPCRYRNARQCAHDNALGSGDPKVCNCSCHAAALRSGEGEGK